MEQNRLKIKIKNLEFKNPVILASGTCGYGEEMKPFINVEDLGGIAIKGLSLKEREGNPSPRISETPCGMINAIGLQNVGVDSFIEGKLPFLSGLNTHIIVNIYGEKIEEYLKIAEKLNEIDSISAIEVNVSCPNVEKGGIEFGKDREMVFALVSSLKKITNIPIFVKLTPESNVISVAQEAEKAGADAVTLINTVPAMIIDTRQKKPFLAAKKGGLSGPCMYPIALKIVYDVYEKINIPIIGVGGIYNTDVALQYMMAGASLIQIGTANLVNPYVSLEIIEGIKKYAEIENITIFDIVGIAHSSC